MLDFILIEQSYDIPCSGRQAAELLEHRWIQHRVMSRVCVIGYWCVGSGPPFRRPSKIIEIP
jgi:hypothetical protein